MPTARLDIVEEHIDMAEFLFDQRCLALDSLDYESADLMEIDVRLLAHLDALVLGEGSAWAVCVPELSGGSVGRAFAAGIVALTSGDAERLEAFREAWAAAQDEGLDGLRWALSLAPWQRESSAYTELAAAATGPGAAAALRAATFSRSYSDELIRSGFASEDPCFNEAACEAAGVFRAATFGADVRRLVASECARVRAAALEALILLEGSAAQGLCRDALTQEPATARIAARALGGLGAADDAAWLRTAASCKDRDVARAALLGLAMLGTEDATEHLVQSIEAGCSSRVAGLAYLHVVGIDDVHLSDRLHVDAAPPEVEATEPDQESEGAQTDEADWHPDDDLPDFDAERTRLHWNQRRSALQGAERFRGGLPLTTLGLRPETPLALRVFEAIEDGLATPGKPLQQTSSLLVSLPLPAGAPC